MNKMCNVCGKRRVGSGGKSYDTQAAASNGVCGPCDEEGGWENTHSDNGHGDLWERFTIIQAGGEAEALTSDELYKIDECKFCWVCRPEINEALKEPKGKAGKPGHHSPRRTQLNHRTQCTHPQTPAARRACREAYWQAEVAKAEQPKGKKTKK